MVPKNGEVEGPKSKNSLGDTFVSQIIFYKGLDVQYHPWGYAMLMTPQRGGMYGARIRA